MEQRTWTHQGLQRAGGLAALYLAASLLAAMAYFLVVAGIPDGASPAEKLTALAAGRGGQYGGMNKGHPDARDIADARAFADSLRHGGDG